MEPPNEIPMFVDVDRGADYPAVDKQTMLASILKEPPTNDTDSSQTQTSTDVDQLVQEQPAETEFKTLKTRIKCPECQRFTTDCEEKMVRHLRKMHLGENPFQCTMCDYSTYNKSLFEEHVRIHKGIKPFQCAYCPYRSASKKNKNKHEQIHRRNNPLKCDQCPFIAHHSRSLQCHKQKHGNGDLITEDGNKDLKCDVCMYKFSSSVTLQRHKNSHSKICEICEQQFCSAYYFKKHMAVAHATQRDAFKCRVCGWVGSVRGRVLLHLIHHPAQPVDEKFDVSVLRKHGIMT